MRIKLLRTPITIVVMLFLASVLWVTSNAQRRTKRKRPSIQKVTVALTAKGYEPTNLHLRRGVLAQVTFMRTVSATCGTQIVLPDYEIKRDLPLNVPVLVEFTPQKSGTFSFTCGMGMLRGSLIVR